MHLRNTSENPLKTLVRLGKLLNKLMKEMRTTHNNVRIFRPFRELSYASLLLDIKKSWANCVFPVMPVLHSITDIHIAFTHRLPINRGRKERLKKTQHHDAWERKTTLGRSLATFR